MWQAHGILPYAGGWLDQPAALLDDFEAFMLLDERHSLDGKRPPPAPRSRSPFDEADP